MAQRSIAIDVRGGRPRDAELRGIEGWLRDEQDVTHHWTLTRPPAPGTAGVVEELVLVAGTTLVGEAVRALVGSLAGWLRTRSRLDDGGRTVVVLRVPGREPVEVTEEGLTAEKVPDLVRRIREELEAATSGGE
ncbi:hypothetical protein IHE55_10970 [Streptomyces pactum]|uniref:Uncharacterized protein n=1 Tax=Streptomyces pactum TaxID=68249 RepID=A0ABS0NJL0_9ACTN|nr:hypothetical protein [Streptomyces pactum]MBH5335284.1 hypothetical protein [Streptomyces pactum]